MSSDTARVLYVEGNIDRTIGGSYYSLLFLVSGLDHSRFEPVVVFSTENALFPRFRAGGARIIVQHPARPTTASGPSSLLLTKIINFLRAIVAEPLRLARLLRRERISILHLNNSITRNHPWMIAAMLAHIPCLTHERGINNHYSLTARLLARRLAAVICISRSVHDNLAAHGLGHLRLVTIHNGLDSAQMHVTRSAAEIRAELGLPTSARLIGITGNIKRWKGQKVLIEALAILQPRFPEIMCLLIGDAPPGEPEYKAEILTLAADLGLDRKVVVTGFRPDVANYVNALEIQIHTSVEPEPFGRVLLEAMALSKPLIASDGGGVPEIVLAGKTGFLFPPGRSEALAECLASLLADPDRAAEMGRAGFRRLQSDFSIIRNVRETEALYERILAS